MNSRHSRVPAARTPALPAHRPQPMLQPIGPQYSAAPNAALLIDFDNVTMGIRSDLQAELKNLLASNIVQGKIAIQRAYADWRRYPQYVLPLTEALIDLIYAPAYGSAKKNATDIRLAIDAMELVFTRPEIGTIILLSGDSDFSSLVIKLKEYGKYVIGVGIRESSSDLLVQNCDEYFSYNTLVGLVRSGDEPTVSHDPWELVSEAVTRMKRNGDVMRADRLKQVMQEIDTNFDEKSLGIAKFSKFVTEASQRGLLSLTKLENGQMEIDLPRERGGAEGGRAATEGDHAPRPATRSESSGENGSTDERGGRRRRGRSRGERRPPATEHTSVTAQEPSHGSDTAGVGETSSGMSETSSPTPPPVTADVVALPPAAPRVVSAPPLATSVSAAPAPLAPPRGFGPRTAGRPGRPGRGDGPPPGLLSIGVVELPTAAPAPIGSGPPAADDTAPSVGVPRRGRASSGTKRDGAAPKAESLTAPQLELGGEALVTADHAPRKRGRGRRGKPAAAAGEAQ